MTKSLSYIKVHQPELGFNQLLYIQYLNSSLFIFVDNYFFKSNIYSLYFEFSQYHHIKSINEKVGLVLLSNFRKGNRKTGY